MLRNIKKIKFITKVIEFGGNNKDKIGNNKIINKLSIKKF